MSERPCIGHKLYFAIAVTEAIMRILVRMALFIVPCYAVNFRCQHMQKNTTEHPMELHDTRDNLLKRPIEAVNSSNSSHQLKCHKLY
jgi:hypothetical protein